MKKILVFLSFLFIATANAEPFTVGEKVIEIPTPKGFVMVTPQMDAVYRYCRHMKPPTSKILAYYIPETDAPLAMSGEMPEIKHLFFVSVNKTIKDFVIASEDFTYIAQKVSQGLKQSFKLDKQTQDFIDKRSKNISKEFNLDLQVKLLNITPFDIHHKSENSFAFSTYDESKVILENYEKEVITSRTITMINVAGKIFTLFCEAPQGQLKWTQSSSIDWSETILKNNPKPPEKSSIKERESFKSRLWKASKPRFSGLLGIWLLWHVFIGLRLFFRFLKNKFKKS